MALVAGVAHMPEGIAGGTRTSDPRSASGLPLSSQL